MSLCFHSSSWFVEIAPLSDGDRTHDGYSFMNTKITMLPKQGVMPACQKYFDAYQALVTL
jgi:hypothetical protein